MFKKVILFFIFLGFISSVNALDFSEISKKALKENKLILLSVESLTCGYCKKMEKETFLPKNNQDKISKEYIRMSVMAEKTKLPDNLHVKYYPTNLILNPKDLSIIDEFVGYMKTEDFLSLLDLVYKQETAN
ncbi:thioredoxin family protein [Sulfurospirillum sp. 1307]|jgi:thioredoxin-related protein